MKAGETTEWREAPNWNRQSMEVWSGLWKQGVVNPGYAVFVSLAQAVIDRSRWSLELPVHT